MSSGRTRASNFVPSAYLRQGSERDSNWSEDATPVDLLPATDNRQIVLLEFHSAEQSQH